MEIYRPEKDPELKKTLEIIALHLKTYETMHTMRRNEIFGKMNLESKSKAYELIIKSCETNDGNDFAKFVNACTMLGFIQVFGPYVDEELKKQS